MQLSGEKEPIFGASDGPSGGFGGRANSDPRVVLAAVVSVDNELLVLGGGSGGLGRDLINNSLLP
jgi:hypothetical protein